MGLGLDFLAAHWLIFLLCDLLFWFLLPWRIFLKVLLRHFALFFSSLVGSCFVLVLWVLSVLLGCPWGCSSALRACGLVGSLFFSSLAAASCGFRHGVLGRLLRRLRVALVFTLLWRSSLAVGECAVHVSRLSWFVDGLFFLWFSLGCCPG